MFKKKQKKVSRSAGISMIPKGYGKIIQWCLNNNIAISIVPNWKLSNGNWKIEIKINNKVHIDPTNYTLANVHNKMYEYYKYYYDKYNKNTK
tara:strand:- start:177 stop:452 length:276 start_codon:yes stop_codon:yes gene_type:complete